ncbi:MAG: XcbB/CpsF family capsular polysaccharide biosynthesis protein [Comamonas sp.]|jgi:hypothetical protein|nr:XcbB/CpsF family capsular polysaccharide biosynthesis protein [Comamonas sp.]
MKRFLVKYEELISNEINYDFSDKKIIDIDLRGLDEGEDKNIIIISRRNALLKRILVKMTNLGFCLYKHEKYISSLVHQSEIKKIWGRVTNGELNTYKSLIYSLEKPVLVDEFPKRLVVVFSSISEGLYSSSLSVRYFWKNFKTIGKYIPQNSYILRIADIGGVVGSYYLNNIFSDKVESHIQELINSFCESKGIDIKSDVVLFGVSKGGTAALYYSLLGGYQAVSIDPIVSDDYYLNEWNDRHFTEGVFPITKQEKFEALLSSDLKINNAFVIYSERSPQYKYINSIVKNSRNGRFINFLNSIHPKIKDHSDVAPMTLNISTALINGIFYGILKSNCDKTII